MTAAFARLDARTRLGVTLATTTSIASLAARSWLGIAMFAALVAVLTAAARPGLGWWLRRIAVAAAWGLFAGWARTLWATPRLPLAIDVASRVTLAIAATLPLAWTMSATQLAETLGRLRLPAGLVAVSTSMARGLAMLSDEATRIVRARMLRAPRAGLATRAALLGSISGAVFSRGIARAERMQQAMELRGFDGAIAPAQPQAFRRVDVVWFIAVLAVAVGAHAVP